MTAEETPTELTPADFAETMRQLNEGEKTATQLEKMLDDLEAKMDSILQEAESSVATNQEKIDEVEKKETTQ